MFAARSLAIPRGAGGAGGGGFTAGVSTHGNTAGTTGLVASQVLFVGSNNITLSGSVNGNSATISFIGGAGAGGGVAVSAGTQLGTSGTIIFSNSNGISFGMSNSSVVTASYTVPSTAGLISAINLSAGTTSQNLSKVTFSDANGLAFGLNGSVVTGSYTVPTVPAQLSVGVSTGGNTVGDTGVFTGRVVLAGGNNITLSGSSNGGSVTVTVSAANQSNQSLGLYASSLTTGQSSSTTVDARSLTVRGMGVASVGYSAGELVISVPSGGGAGDGVNILAAGTQTANTTGTVLFQNSNGITFGMSNSSVITASYTVPTQSNQTLGLYASSQTTGQSSSTTVDARSLTVRGMGVASVGYSAGELVISVPSGGGAGDGVNILAAGTQTANTTGTVVFSNSNNVTFGMSNSSVVTASVTVASTQGSIVVSAGTTSNTGSQFVWSNSNNVSFGLNGSTITATATVASTQGSIVISAGTTSTTASQYVFSNSNNVSFGINGATVTATITVPAQTNQTAGIYVTAQSTGQSSSSTYDARTLSIVPDGIISAGWSNGSFRISATQSNQAFSAAGGSSAFQTLGFSDNGAASFTNTNGSVAIASVRLSAYATSNTTQSSSGTLNLNSVIFAGAGIASVGVTNGSIVVSVPSGGGAGDGGVFAGVSTGGNTAGSTGTVSTGNFVLVGSGALTLSQSTGAAGSAATVTFSVPQTSSLVGTNGMSISTNGSTISVSQIEGSIWRQMGQITAAGTAQANSLVSIQPFILAEPIALSQVMIAVSANVGSSANNSSAYLDISASAVIYSRNGSSLSSIGSFNNGGVTQSFSSNATGSVTGVLALTMTGAGKTLTAGEYFLAVHMSTNNTATGGANTTAIANTISMILSASIGSAANLVKVWGSQTNNSLGLMGGLGILSTGATRGSIGFSDYTMTGTRGFLAPVAFELRNASWW